MRRLIKQLLTAGVLAATVLGGAVAQAQTTMERIVQDGKITIAVQTQGPPVSFVNRDGERTGLAVEVARMMAEDMGLELVVQDYDWKGLIPSLLSDKADFIAADMTPTAKRSLQLLFTEPVFFTEVVAFTTRDAPFKNWHELNKPEVELAVVQATTYAAAAKQYLPDATLKEFAGGTAQTVPAVIAGRADAGVSDSATLSTYLEAYDELVQLEGVLKKEPLSFAVRPDSPHLLASLDNYIRLITHDGRLQQLLDYWWNSTAWKEDHM